MTTYPLATIKFAKRDEVVVLVVGKEEIFVLGSTVTLHAHRDATGNHHATLRRIHRINAAVRKVFDPIPIAVLRIEALRTVHHGDCGERLSIFRVVLLNDDGAMGR